MKRRAHYNKKKYFFPRIKYLLSVRCFICTQFYFCEKDEGTIWLEFPVEDGLFFGIMCHDDGCVLGDGKSSCLAFTSVWVDRQSFLVDWHAYGSNLWHIAVEHVFVPCNMVTITILVWSWFILLHRWTGLLSSTTLFHLTWLLCDFDDFRLISQLKS